ncbi:MAG: glycoside hydrolase family 97 N-terminal domain-containing protein, partial [Prevotella sp.]|nr:glycoside hydrolase family 97 N-terminal domain-containing protein [Prevotella sp.]
MKKINITILLLVAVIPLIAIEVSSPNKQLKVEFSIDKGRPAYQLFYKNQTVIKTSHLGLQ